MFLFTPGKVYFPSTFYNLFYFNLYDFFLGYSSSTTFIAGSLMITSEITMPEDGWF